MTRIINQVDKNLRSPGGASVLRLRQHKTSLSEKLVVLSRLDDELIEMVEEEDLSREVEQANEITKRIGLCIMEIDEVLASSVSSSVGPLAPATEFPLVSSRPGYHCHHPDYWTCGGTSHQCRHGWP